MTSTGSGLSAITDGAGVIRVLAIDHRDSLRAVIGEATDDQLSEFKGDLVEAAGDFVSGVMLDPAFGMQPAVVQRVRAGTGVIAALEAQGYLADDSVTHTTLLDGWDGHQARAAGADAAKFLALWDGAPNRLQMSVIADARRTAHDANLPLVLEPLPRSLSPFGSWVAEWCDVHVGAGADVYKLPYPGSLDECRRISALLDQPWTILSAGVDFDTFFGQAEEAARAGAAGYIVGRAVWREAATMDRAARERATTDLVIPRLRRLGEIEFSPPEPTPI